MNAMLIIEDEFTESERFDVIKFPLKLGVAALTGQRDGRELKGHDGISSDYLKNAGMDGLTRKTGTRDPDQVNIDKANDILESAMNIDDQVTDGESAMSITNQNESVISEGESDISVTNQNESVMSATSASGSCIPVTPLISEMAQNESTMSLALVNEPVMSDFVPIESAKYTGQDLVKSDEVCVGTGQDTDNILIKASAGQDTIIITETRSRDKVPVPRNSYSVKVKRMALDMLQQHSMYHVAESLNVPLTNLYRWKAQADKILNKKVTTINTRFRKT